MIENRAYFKLYDNLLKKLKNEEKKILIWGACEKFNCILDLLSKEGLKPYGYIDSNTFGTYFNEYKVYEKNIIKTEKFFIIIPLEENYISILDFLYKCDYKEFIDFYYPNHEIEISLDKGEVYQDLYGNFCESKSKIDEIHIKQGGKIKIGTNCKINNLKIECFFNSYIEIDDDVIFGDNVEIKVRKNSIVKIENKCIISNNCMIFIYNDSEFNFKEQSTIGNNGIIWAVQNSNVMISVDCMISRNVHFRVGNGHNLFDINTGENLNKKGKSIVLGKHVWVGTDCRILHGTDIGSGSVLGMNTFVNKAFPNNCCIAGNPAKIVREKVAWRRDQYPLFDTYDDFKDFDFTNV